jgi:gluconokinase
MACNNNKHTFSHLLLMGVCGSGKSTVGALLSAAHGLPLHDADAFHPPANLAKMSSGQALTDEDRAPWLAALARRMGEECSAGRRCIFTCSALKRAYRDALRAGLPGDRPLALVLLRADGQTLAARLAARAGHFFPPALLASQLAALEPQGPGEPPFATVDAAAGCSADSTAAAVVAACGSFFSA